MSEVEATRFINDLHSDLDLSTEFVMVKDNPTASYNLVKQKGYDATPDEIREAFLETSTGVYTEEQIAEISAGLSTGQKAGIAAGAVGGAAAVGVGVGVTAVAICIAAGAGAAGAAI